ncbi:hypothetical protein MBLNU459_g5846t1 [Dothideomycetes sp. NU459]
MPSKHKINLRDSRPVFGNEHGTIQEFTTSQLPILKNLSLQRVCFEAGGILEPKWVVNCNVLAYCPEGIILVNILDSASEMASFTVKPGQMFHVKSGALFHIENIVSQKGTVLLAMRHEKPKNYTMAGAAGAFTDAVLGNTFDVESSFFTKIRRPIDAKVIACRQGVPTIPTNAHWPTPHRFDVEEMQPPTFAEGVGSAGGHVPSSFGCCVWY